MISCLFRVFYMDFIVICDTGPTKVDCVMKQAVKGNVNGKPKREIAIERRLLIKAQ